MAMTTQESITSGQRRKIIQFADDAVEKVLEEMNLEKGDGQLAIERGDVFAAAIRKTTFTTLRSLTNRDQFSTEEVSSTYTYPPGYAIKPITEQMETLVRHFPSLNAEQTRIFIKDELPKLELPEGAEGWFAIPRWQKLGATYGEALQLTLSKLAETRTLYNYREGQIGPDRLRQHERTVRMMSEIEKQQPGDILIVPAQFGLRHRGRSVRRAREVFTSNEFGLGAFACGCMLLTHPEREQKWEQLHVDCSGDEYDPGAGGRFDGAPRFNLNDDGLEFVTGWVDRPGQGFGAVSGFLPQ